MTAPEGPSTERLWLTDSRRATSISVVTAVKGHAFALDRSLYAPTSREHRHPQPHDTGTVWVAGEKRRLVRSYVRDDILWHELRGTVPKVGDRLQCQLDTDRRTEVSRSHTALHLMLAALRAEGAPPLVSDPVVKLGGTFRLDLAGFVPPAVLAAALRRVRAWVAADKKVEPFFVPRGAETNLLDAQAFQPPDPYPGPFTTLSAIRIEGVCAYPCDGTHVERTGKVGEVVVAAAHPDRRGGYVVVGKVA